MKTMKFEIPRFDPDGMGYGNIVIEIDPASGDVEVSGEVEARREDEEGKLIDVPLFRGPIEAPNETAA